MLAISAAHSLAAVSTSVSSTGCRSKAEWLMILSTSAVAVCRSSASLSSRVSRATSVFLAVGAIWDVLWP